MLLWLGTATCTQCELCECSLIKKKKIHKTRDAKHLFISVRHPSLHQLNVICCDNKCIEKERGPGLLTVLFQASRNPCSSFSRCCDGGMTLAQPFKHTLCCQKYLLTHPNDQNQVFQYHPWTQVYKMKHPDMQTVL